MARGNAIIISANPRGVFHEGIVAAGETPSPGTVMQIQVATAIGGDGRYTWEAFDRDADGNHPAGPLGVLLEDFDAGLNTTAYAAGERCRLYTPVAGEELNMLIADVAGTGDDHAIGELLIVNDGDGLLIATTGSPESEPFMLLETITDPTANTLAYCIYTGY